MYTILQGSQTSELLVARQNLPEEPSSFNNALVPKGLLFSLFKMCLPYRIKLETPESVYYNVKVSMPSFMNGPLLLLVHISINVSATFT